MVPKSQGSEADETAQGGDVPPLTRDGQGKTDQRKSSTISLRPKELSLLSVGVLLPARVLLRSKPQLVKPMLPDSNVNLSTTAAIGSWL